MNLKLDGDNLEPKEVIPELSQLNLSKVELVELFRFYGASSKSIAYQNFYRLLDRKITYSALNPNTILEIGTASGASARSFATRFPDSNVFTLDVRPACAKIFAHHPNIHPLTCDTSSDSDIERAINTINSPIDVVIDDGSHLSDDVARTFKHIQPYLSQKFIYIIEDCDSIGNLGYSQHMSRNFGRLEHENRREVFLVLLNTFMHLSDSSDKSHSLDIFYSRKLLSISRGLELTST